MIRWDVLGVCSWLACQAVGILASTAFIGEVPSALRASRQMLVEYLLFSLLVLFFAAVGFYAVDIASQIPVLLNAG
jgi:hypothetical protein